MNSVILLLGSNEGDRCGYLASAKALLNEKAGTIRKESSIYQTAAWGKTDQDAFLNQALVLDTSLDPMALLQRTQEIEQQLGRERIVRWGSRTLDIDILFFNKQQIDTEQLTVPHPGIPDRRFALVPLQDIGSEYIHPTLGLSLSELLVRCPDQLEVSVFVCEMNP